MSSSPPASLQAPSSPGPSAPAQAGRGVILLAAGGAIAIVTWWARTASTQPLPRYLPYVLMLAGAYLAVTGIELLARAWRARDSVSGGSAGASLRRRLAAGVVVVLAIVAGGAAAWFDRAPYWRAVADLARGDTATESLRAIAERQAARLQAGASGSEALASWRTSATQGLALKETFARSRQAAVYLAGASSGALKERADEDVIFYGLCVEWMALYEQVRTEIDATSMGEPPAAWGETQDAIIQRIQELPSARSSR